MNWELDDYQEPFDTMMDNAGDFYKNEYGPAFTNALELSFHTYCKEIPFGTDGWLTVSLLARDWNKDGVIENETALQVDTLVALSTMVEVGALLLLPPLVFCCCLRRDMDMM
jgi:hypothetical protein